MRIIFATSKNNRNSITALCGVIEKEGLDLPVQLIKEENLVEFLKKQKNFEKKILAFSFQTPDIFHLEELIPKIKKIDNNFLLITGGAHPSGAPEQTLKMGFDHVFIGEAEETFIDFLKKILEEKKVTEKIIRGKPADITLYPSISEKYQAFGAIEITRGCPFGCYYCQTTYLFGRVRHRTIKQIVAMAEILVRNGWLDIRFVSPNFLSYGSKDGFKPSLDSLERMLSAVRSTKGVRKISAASFPSEVRPEQVTKKTLEIIKAYADNDNLIIGAQSGSDSMLKKCHRGHSIARLEKAIDLILGAGLKVNVDFIFGMPGETSEEEKETIKLMKKLAEMKGVRIHGHAFLPLPGTPWEKEKPGRISPKLRELLKELRAKGKEYGDWEKQLKMGKMISDLRAN